MRTSPLYIIFQREMLKIAFLHLRLVYVAVWLRRPPGDFNGSMGFPNGGMGPNGFNGTFGGPGGDNFTRPDVSGAPNGYNEDNGQVTGSQTDYTLIVETVAVAGVAAVIVVTAALLLHKKKAAKFTHVPEATEASIF